MLSVESVWCTRLRDLLVEKQRVIIAGKIVELDRITAEEELLAKQLGEKVSERAELMGKITRSYELDLSKPQLSILKTLAPRDLVPALSRLIKQTEAAAHQITETNRQNEYLLQASLDYARGMIDLLYNYQVQDMTLYGPRGIAGKYPADKRLLDRKV